jgi:primosomal protein N' (replication factor Y) (superfamily II helicase)
LSELALPTGAEVLGPVEVGSAAADPADAERALIRIGLGRGRELAAALHTTRAARSARKEPVPVRSRMDPVELF